jgi:23S rRNA (uracil1939-C5)-methyltransferase
LSRRWRGRRAAGAPIQPCDPTPLCIEGLAAGGDGFGRGADGRVTFVPRTVPGDRVTIAMSHSTASYARGELLRVDSPSPQRRPSRCPAFDAGCGGCQWLHIEEQAQHLAKQQLVASALRQLPGLQIAAMQTPVPAQGWRRRARFHVRAGRLGLYAARSHRVIAIGHCSQLDPRLAALLPTIAASAPPDGELAMAVGIGDHIALAHSAPDWPGAAALIGKAGVIGVVTASASWGDPVVEVEPGLWGRADAFAQASREGNAAIVAAVVAALGPGQGRRALELFAGAGNLTRAIVAAGWHVVASDVAAPARPLPGVENVIAEASVALATLSARADEFSALVLDPPRTGAKAIMATLAGMRADRVVYVSCDAATLARDAALLARGGYRATLAQPIDAMPQTSHLEIVLTLQRS